MGFNLGTFSLLVYINDLAEGLTTNAKLFADDTSLQLHQYHLQ